jgi:hypothetical protein
VHYIITKVIKDDIGMLRQELEDSFLGNSMTTDKDILELSRKLDKVILKYYIHHDEKKNNIINF